MPKVKGEEALKVLILELDTTRQAFKDELKRYIERLKDLNDSI